METPVTAPSCAGGTRDSPRGDGTPATAPQPARQPARGGKGRDRVTARRCSGETRDPREGTARRDSGDSPALPRRGRDTSEGTGHL